MKNITDQIKKWLNYAYRCGKTDAQRGTSKAHANMRFALFEPVKLYEKETGNTVDWHWFDKFYYAGVTDYHQQKKTFAEHLRECFADDLSEGGNTND